MGFVGKHIHAFVVGFFWVCSHWLRYDIILVKSAFEKVLKIREESFWVLIKIFFVFFCKISYTISVPFKKHVKIWTNCKQARKMRENVCFQNIQTNTCKNESVKPVFMRLPKGYRRNGISPLRALTHQPFYECKLCLP